MKQKSLTIITSETELIERIYIVTPTITGTPEKDKRGTSQSRINKMDPTANICFGEL